MQHPKGTTLRITDDIVAIKELDGSRHEFGPGTLATVVSYEPWAEIAVMIDGNPYLIKNGGDFVLVPTEVWCSHCDQPATVEVRRDDGTVESQCDRHHRDAGPSNLAIGANRIVCADCGKPAYVRSSFDGDSAWPEHGDIRPRGLDVPAGAGDAVEAFRG